MKTMPNNFAAGGDPLVGGGDIGMQGFATVGPGMPAQSPFALGGKTLNPHVV